LGNARWLTSPIGKEAFRHILPSTDQFVTGATFESGPFAIERNEVEGQAYLLGKALVEAALASLFAAEGWLFSYLIRHHLGLLLSVNQGKSKYHAEENIWFRVQRRQLGEKQ
jgi:hypothetical protein